MSETDHVALVKRALFAVAPDVEGMEIDPNETFRDQFDIDSMDFLNFVIGLSRATGLAIPEADYPELERLAGCIAYLDRKMLR